MSTELEVAYLGIQVADPTGFGTFLRDIVGLIPGETTADDATTWRNDDRVHRILVEEGPANDAVFVGLEARTPELFTQAVDRARAGGASVTEATAADAAIAPVLEIAVGAPVLLTERRLLALDGRPLELSFGRARGDRMVLTTVMRGPRPGAPRG